MEKGHRLRGVEEVVYSRPLCCYLRLWENTL